MNTLHVKKGDTVEVISGKCKGQRGKVVATALRADVKVDTDDATKYNVNGTKYTKETVTEYAFNVYTSAPAAEYDMVNLIDADGNGKVNNRDLGLLQKKLNN